MNRLKIFISSVQSEFAEERAMLSHYIRTDVLLGKPHRSSPPNILLAEPMYWNGYIEKVGSGTEDLVERCVNYGLKKPEFVQDANFQVTLWRNVSAEEVAESNWETGGQSSSLNEKSSEKDLEKDLQKDLQKLTENQKKILAFIKEFPYITQNELSKNIGINAKNIRNNISKLKSLGILSRIGPDKGGYWQINREDNKVTE